MNEWRETTSRIIIIELQTAGERERGIESGEKRCERNCVKGQKCCFRKDQ